jgi:cytochrome P450
MADTMNRSSLQSEPAVYNPFAPGFREDPYPQLHRLRSQEPVHWSHQARCWVLTGYNDIKLVLAEPRFQIALELLEQNPAVKQVMLEPFNRIIRGQILANDPPAHPRIRAIMAKGFTPARLEQLRPLIQRCVDTCIDVGLENGSIDLISGFAYRMPFLVICEMIGVPEGEREPLITFTHDLMRCTDPTPMSAEELRRCNEAAEGFRNYFYSLAARRAKLPSENVFDEMLAACSEEKISWDELIANYILLFNAGHDTVVNLFGNGLLALHRNPEQLALLRSDPSLIRNAIEELLRYDTSVTIARRTAIETVQIREHTIAAGQYVLCLLNAANRDPEVFEDPDRLDVRRKNIRPLSFGGGIHHCLGSQLARLEGLIGFTTLLKRMPELELETLDPPWRQNVFIRGLESLPARSSPRSRRRHPHVLAPLSDGAPGAVDWLKYDARTTFFTYALQYLNWENVEGDILEFGVANGKSLALLSRLHEENLRTWQYPDNVVHERRCAGFDSLEGLPADDARPHPRWNTGSFASNYHYGHPAMAFDEPITAESLYRLFKLCGVPRPEIEVGWFDATIAATIPSKYQKAALVHIDSDLYASARCVLEGVAPILANGALLLFDDWFMYRGDPNEGEARALSDFLADHPEWQAIHYQPYSVFCNSFILRRVGSQAERGADTQVVHEAHDSVSGLQT